MLSEPSRSQEEQPVRYTLLSSVRFRRSSQWRVCFVALLLRPRNGRVGSQTGYEHKARHSRAGRDERPPVRHRWKSPERYTWEHFTNEAENRSTLLGLFFSKAVWKRSHYEKVNSVRYGQLLFHTFKKQKKKITWKSSSVFVPCSASDCRNPIVFRFEKEILKSWNCFWWLIPAFVVGWFECVVPGDSVCVQVSASVELLVKSTALAKSLAFRLWQNSDNINIYWSGNGEIWAETARLSGLKT